ncbi:MAG: Ig-like domain-containing protein, partial [Coriobacteriia bacterium]|nr:Ig-like domain-containing protein [Coriobacteriia bacterium]
APLATVSPAAAEPVPVSGLKLNKTDLELNVGQTATLKATISPADATETGIVWASTDADIAAVGTDGTVTATGAGTATVTATSLDGGWAEACEVTVAEGIIRVADVTLDQSALALEIGQSATLTATVHPADAHYRDVFWDSDNPYVATVDQDGVVTAHGTGTATITATSEDSGHFAICEVTVASPPATDSGNVAGVTTLTTPKTADGSLGYWALVIDLLAIGLIGLFAGVARRVYVRRQRGDKPVQ